jgi:hypothetical protein
MRNYELRFLEIVIENLKSKKKKSQPNEVE